MTKGADASHDIAPHPQKMRDSFGETFRVLKLDDPSKQEKWIRLCEERERMREEVEELRRIPRLENSAHGIKSSLCDMPALLTISYSPAATHTHDVNSTQLRMSSTDYERELHHRRELLKPDEQRTSLVKGLQADTLDLGSRPLDGDIDAYALTMKYGDSKTAMPDSLVPHLRVSALEQSRESHQVSENRGCSDRSYAYTTSPSGRMMSSCHCRMPGVYSALGRVYMQESPTPTSLSNSHVDSTMRSGTQSVVHERTFWINLWPCFGTFTSFVCKPTRIVVNSGYRYMEQLMEKAGMITGCQPAPTVLYEPNGRAVRSLAQLTPEQHYLLFPCGGLYRKEAIPAALLVELVRAAKTTIQQRIVIPEN